MQRLPLFTNYDPLIYNVKKSNVAVITYVYKRDDGYVYRP